MAHLFKKKSHGILYLYKGEGKRINGKPTCVKCKSLGRYDEFKEYFQKKFNIISIEHQDHFEYGLSKAIYELSKQLMLEKIFENNISKRTKDKWLNKRLVLMAINRIIFPVPKYHLQDWYKTSDLINYLDIPVEELEYQKVYRTMDMLDRYNPEVQEDMCRSLSLQEKLSFDLLYLDFTNQETYSKNKNSKILKKGHNKRKRFDLRQINISLNCDANSAIPFFYKVYPGNINDPAFIKDYAPELRERLSSIGLTGKSTLIIDRGINGDENFKLLRDNDFDYIGGLKEDDFKEFFVIPKSKLRKRYTKKRVGKTDLTIKFNSQITMIYGEKHLVISAYTNELDDERKNEFEEKLISYEKKCEKKLIEVKRDIIEKTIDSRLNSIEKIKTILKKINSKLSNLYIFEIKSYRFELTWKISRNEAKIEEYKDSLTRFVLFTNKVGLEPKKVIEYYFDKDKIEKNFQILKSNAYNYKHVILGPMFHKRDDRIESHTATCMLALQMYQVIDYRIKKSELDISTQQALAELRKITCYYTKLEDNPFPVRHINPISELQKQILEALKVNIF